MSVSQVCRRTSSGVGALPREWAEIHTRRAPRVNLVLRGSAGVVKIGVQTSNVGDHLVHCQCAEPPSVITYRALLRQVMYNEAKVRYFVDFWKPGEPDESCRGSLVGDPHSSSASAPDIYYTDEDTGHARYRAERWTCVSQRSVASGPGFSPPYCQPVALPNIQYINTFTATALQEQPHNQKDRLDHDLLWSWNVCMQSNSSDATNVQ